MICKQMLLSGLGLLALNYSLAVSTANAQDAEIMPAPQAVQKGNVYALAYFEQYEPRTALDMAARIPGFSISNGNTSKRGLGEGGANVLINGKRISGKTSASDRLSRINASSVVRIEILDGASLDIPGLSGQVANIIYKSTTVTGNWKWTPWLRHRIEPNLLAGEVNLSGQNGALQWSVALKNSAFRFGNHGKEFRRSADGTLIETRDEVTHFSRDAPKLATSLNWTPQAEHIINVNAEISKANFEINEFSDHSAATNRGDNDVTRFDNGSDALNAEIGADYVFPFGPKRLDGTLKLIGVGRYRDGPSRSRFSTFAPFALSDQTRFSQNNKTSEAIGRAEYAWSEKGGNDWQFSLESAYNRLNAKSGLQVLDTASGGLIDIPLTGGSSIVSEKRGEVTLAHTRKISPKINIQTLAGFEYSVLAQSGSQNVERSFFRPKGYIQASFKPSDNVSIRPRIARDVGQLNFNDFISSVSLRDDLSSAGNANLVPEQSWALEVAFEKKFAYGTIVTIRPYVDFISDLVDRIPIGTDGDAVGNIDSARRYGLDIDATLKGEAFGLDGLQLDLVLDLRRSEVDDPLTSAQRRLNNDKISLWKASLRHDIKGSDWAYGSTIEDSRRALVFRLDTISTPGGGDIQSKPKLSAFIEHKNIFGLTLKADMSNLLNGLDVSDRSLFTGRRDLGVVDITETSRRQFGQTLRLSLSGSF